MGTSRIALIARIGRFDAPEREPLSAPPTAATAATGATGASPAATELEKLRRKYERMLALRDAHADTSAPEPDPRPEMASLAEQYPGVLREIDRLPRDIILARIDALAGAMTAPSRAEPWMIAQVVFHRHARGALATKRWLAGRKHVTDGDTTAFHAALSTQPWGADAALYADALDAVASPPAGRLMNLVFEKVGGLLGLTASEARHLVFGVADDED